MKGFFAFDISNIEPPEHLLFSINNKNMYLFVIPLDQRVNTKVIIRFDDDKNLIIDDVIMP